MRSHPYTPPPPLPRILDDLVDELSAILPNSERRRASDPEIELGDLDPESSRLLPVKRKRHTVRVQGKLVVVRSVSTVNLAGGLAGGGGGGRYESAVSSAAVGAPRRPRARRRSLEQPTRRRFDGSLSDDDDRGGDMEVIRSDRQLRGYGIGGAGNIRRIGPPCCFFYKLHTQLEALRLGSLTLFLVGRPTEVIHFPSRRPSSLVLLSRSSLSLPPSPTGPAPDTKTKWSIRELFGFTGDRKGKAKRYV